MSEQEATDPPKEEEVEKAAETAGEDGAPHKEEESTATFEPVVSRPKP
jgi:hypothetical protein